MLQVANYIALPAALVGGVSALMGGAVADRMAKRYGLHSQAWVIAAMKLIAFPFAVSFYFFDHPVIAIGAYFVSLLFAGVYLGPTYALIQHLAPLRLRAMWAALTLLTVNLIGLGVGPLAVGQLSDWLVPTFGEQSLRYAMLAVSMITPVPIFLYWRAGVLMKKRATG
jgi:MFS family permease